MSERILVTGKKISSMELVTNITGNEKIPTGQQDDLAIIPNQLADYTIARGSLVNRDDLLQVEGDLGIQVEDLARSLAAEEAARIAADNLKVDKEGSVSSVAGRVGDVVLVPSDVLVGGFGSQEDVNKYVAKPFLSGYTYGLGERVVLNGGEIVKSTVEGNVTNPNGSMVGWVSVVSDSLATTVQTFNTPEAGVDPVTGVADGAYFNVRSEDDDTSAVEYQNVGGSAVATGKRYLSAPDVVAVDSIADLLALPEGQRKEGMRYLVKGYYAGSDVGGGEFYWDSTSTVEPDQGVYFSLLGQTSGRFIRLIDGLIATPYWFGIPHQSFDVDNTGRIQSLISLPRFAFPKGFKSSVSTLYPVSGTTGFFNDAVLTLLSGMPNLTPIISFELKDGEVPSHIYYYGGVLDGNRGAESGEGQGGQDGGLHCCRVYAGEGIKWYDPVFQNAASDGIYVNQSGGGVISGVKFIRPDCNNNSRQGASIINCHHLEFEDGTFRNTNGKLPEAGIDVEPNSPTESVTVVFSGTTTISNNAGRGFVMDSQGSVSEYLVIFDRMDISGVDSEGQSMRATGGGLKKLIGNRLTMEGGLSFGGGFSLDFKCDYVSSRSLAITGRLDATTKMDVDINTLFLDQTLNAPAIDVRVYDFGGKYNLNLPNSYLRNSSLGASGFCANIHSNNNVTGFLRAFILPRVEGAATVNTAVLLSGDFSSKFSTEVNVREPIGYSSAIRVWEGSRGANITARKSSPDSDDLVRLDGSECIVDAVWEQASGRVVHIAGNSAEDNIVSVKAINASYTASLAGTPSYRNYLTNSVLSRDDGGTVLTGAGWVVSGSILNGVPSGVQPPVEQPVDSE